MEQEETADATPETRLICTPVREGFGVVVSCDVGSRDLGFRATLNPKR